MDPLSAAVSIAGLITAVGKVYNLLDFISSVKNSPTTIRDAKDEVGHAQLALRSMERYLNRLTSLSPKRTALIQVDDLRVTLADAMMAFSDFETLLLTLANIARVKAAIAWPKYAKDVEEHMAKVQRYKASLTLMLNILQWCNSFDARSASTKRQEDDQSTIWADDDEDDAETIRGSIRESVGSGSHKDVSKKGHQSRMLRLPFEKILEQSWVYKRNQRNDCDCSFISSAERSHAWSVFSGFSLADVSILSVIAMPLTTVDLANGKHYQVEIRNQSLACTPDDFDESSSSKSPTSPAVPTLPNLGLGDLRLTWNMPTQEEKELRDWMSESGSEIGDEEAAERAHTPVSDSDGLGKADKTNNKPEDGNKNCVGKLYTCAGCGELVEENQAFELGEFSVHAECSGC
ncbi:hypothetical protein ACHAPT_003591 [Fusarium lateritium]